MSCFQSINCDVIYAIARQRSSIVSLFEIVGGDSQFLLIIYINRQRFAIVDHILRHSPAIAGYHTIVYPCPRKISGIYRVSITNSEMFSRRISNCIPIHIQIIDCDLGGNEIVVFEDQNIVCCNRGKDQFLHILNRIIVILGIVSKTIVAHPILVCGNCQFNNRNRIA